MKRLEQSLIIRQRANCIGRRIVPYKSFVFPQSLSPVIDIVTDVEKVVDPAGALVNGGNSLVSGLRQAATTPTYNISPALLSNPPLSNMTS